MKRASSPWAAIDAAKAAWERQRADIDVRLQAAGVRPRFRAGPSGIRVRVPLVEAGEHGELVVRLGLGVLITGRDEAALLSGVKPALEELRELRAARREAREAKKARLAARATLLTEVRR